MLKALKYDILRGVKAGGPAVPLAEKPVRVATLINEASFNEDQVLSHNYNVFLEDHIHDWNWDQRDGGRFRYYSRVAEVADVLIVYELDKDYQPIPKFDPMTGQPINRAQRKNPMNFVPQFHIKNSAGQWQMSPFDPRFAVQAADEAKRIAEEGGGLAPVVDEGASFVPKWAK